MLRLKAHIVWVSFHSMFTWHLRIWMGMNIETFSHTYKSTYPHTLLALMWYYEGECQSDFEANTPMRSHTRIAHVSGKSVNRENDVIDQNENFVQLLLLTLLTFSK